jgi:hypothetical protein
LSFAFASFQPFTISRRQAYYITSQMDLLESG